MGIQQELYAEIRGLAVETTKVDELDWEELFDSLPRRQKYANFFLAIDSRVHGDDWREYFVSWNGLLASTSILRFKEIGIPNLSSIILRMFKVAPFLPNALEFQSVRNLVTEVLSEVVFS